MADQTQEIMDTAQKLGDLVSKHPATEKYRQAQKAVSDDPEAARLLADFDRQIESLARQEQTGMPVTDAQRQQLESLQSRIASHIKVKNLSLAQVDFMDLLRKISQTWQRPLAEASPAAGAARSGAGARLA